MAKNCPNCHSVKSMVDELHAAFVTTEIDDHCKLCGYRHTVKIKRDDDGNPIIPTRYVQNVSGGYGVYVRFDPVTTQYIEMAFTKPTDIFDPIIQSLKTDEEIVFISVMNHGSLEIIKNDRYASMTFDE